MTPPVWFYSLIITAIIAGLYLGFMTMLMLRDIRDELERGNDDSANAERAHEERMDKQDRESPRMLSNAARRN